MAYNGWTNYETWNLNLWIENEEPLYRAKQSVIRRAWNPITGDDVKRFFLAVMDGTTPDFDMLRESGETVDPINFDEIAEHWELDRQEYEAENAD